LISSQDSQVFYLSLAGAAAVSTVVANQGAIAEEQQIRIRIKMGVAHVASKAIDVPPVAS